MSISLSLYSYSNIHIHIYTYIYIYIYIYIDIVTSARLAVSERVPSAEVGRMSPGKLAS